MVLILSDNGRPFPRCKTTVYDSGIKTPWIVRWPGTVKPGTRCKSLVSAIDLAPTILEIAEVEIPESFQGVSFREQLSNPETSTRTEIFAEHNWHDYQAHERAVRTARYKYIRNSLPELSASPPADAVRSVTYQAMQQLSKQYQLGWFQH